ncbi:hypothetical protein PTTG_30518, partial [Puccinia triticina 1-1 BBBD Race 1]
MFAPFAHARLLANLEATTGAPPTALLSHAGQLFVATAAGSLFVFTASAAAAELAKSFGSLRGTTQPIDGLCLLTEPRALAVLAAGNVSLHDPAQLTLLSSCQKWTRAQASALSPHAAVLRPAGSQLVPQPPGPPQHAAPPVLLSILAVPCRRRLVLFLWRDGQWLEPKEIALPHQVRSLVFPPRSASSSATPPATTPPSPSPSPPTAASRSATPSPTPSPRRSPASSPAPTPPRPCPSPRRKPPGSPAWHSRPPASPSSASPEQPSSPATPSSPPARPPTSSSASGNTSPPSSPSTENSPAPTPSSTPEPRRSPLASSTPPRPPSPSSDRPTCSRSSNPARPPPRSSSTPCPPSPTSKPSRSPPPPTRSHLTRHP